MLARPRALALLLVLLLSSCAAGGSALARPASSRSLFAAAVAARRAQPNPGRAHAPAQLDACAEGVLCGDGIVADPPTSAGMCPPSVALFEAFESCMCSSGGACAAVCGEACDDGLLVGPFPLSPDCEACWQRTTGAIVDGVPQAPGCAAPFNACVDD